MKRPAPAKVAGAVRRRAAAPAVEPCPTCRGHTVIDEGVDAESGTDLIAECPDC